MRSGGLKQLTAITRASGKTRLRALVSWLLFMDLQNPTVGGTAWSNQPVTTSAPDVGLVCA